MDFMEVYCISERPGITQLKKGDFYTIKRDSIWIDADGDAYGQVYKIDGAYVGQLKLNHFCSC